MQRRELAALAADRGLVVVAEFTDSVESGKDEDRPGLQALLGELYKKDREWSVVLALDTSRIARRAAAAYWFEDRECRPRGVTVVYKNLPDMDEAERAIVKAVFHGVDEWHSLVSKRKGLAGMRENIRNGWRAGGRAPRGYRLEREATGAVRDGAPVMKSRLAPTEEAGKISAYLVDRAARIPRSRAARKHGLEVPQTTLLSIERNALTYAGHTVWNVLSERGVIGPKYRPRSEWVIQRGTHPALIAEDVAEAILAQLVKRAPKQTHDAKEQYLLSGLLYAPAGGRWHGDKGGFYRCGKGRRVLARRVDATVVRCLSEDLAGPKLAGVILEHMRRRLLQPIDAKAIAGARRRLAELERRIRGLTDHVAEASAAGAAAPMLRALGEAEKEREAAAGELEKLEREASTQRALRKVTEDQVREGLRKMAVDVATRKDVNGLREQLMRLLERVELDPENPSELVLKLRRGVLLASPQRPDEYPPISWRARLAA